MNKLMKLAVASCAALLSLQSQAAGTSVKHPDWSRNAVIYEINTRQYTPEGTFDAFAEHLPRLRQLGADILWFMPIHPISEVNRKGTLGSYYAVKDYTGVNPEFGNLESFKATVDKAHQLGMKVIIDWVPNHTGCDNAWTVEHPDWFARDDKGQMYGPFDWSDVFQLDYNNPQMRQAMIDAMLFWVKEIGIDGFRCDVAGRVPVDFWDECRRQLEAAKGEGQLFMLAEATEPELLDNAFDMDYNWPMKDLQNAIASTLGEYAYVRDGQNQPDRLPSKNASDIKLLLDEQAAQYPAGSYMMNMVTNHDLNSWEGTEYERYGNYLPAMTVLSYILPGMPLIYTGQEVQLDRALEFFEKDPVMEFSALKQPGSRASQWTAMLQNLNTFKHDYPQLAAGIDNTEVAASANPSEHLVIIRKPVDGRTESVIGLMNLGKQPMDISSYTAKAKASAAYGRAGLMPLPESLAPGEAAIIVCE